MFGYNLAMLGQHQKTVVPDLIEPVVGWKAWNLVDNYGKKMLASPDRGLLWPARIHVEAQCAHHGAGRLSCHCGINAFARQSELERSIYAQADIVGQIELWGEVQSYKKGYRGQYAKPKLLIVEQNRIGARNIAQQLAETYGCEVHIGPSRRNLGSSNAPISRTSSAFSFPDMLPILLLPLFLLMIITGDPKSKEAPKEKRPVAAQKIEQREHAIQVSKALQKYSLQSRQKLALDHKGILQVIHPKTDSEKEAFAIEFASWKDGECRMEQTIKTCLTPNRQLSTVQALK